ncbi:MAG: Phosphate transport regulator (distant homolog of PhoU) [uncultured Nocardioidaceae bacterium]|uniref:Phosphate transport regulator (Distant homolog of PhoU) n=1 Tax=uncultured Nocardioidaceae bacterium TaxID=253824 RepID=A0A6J4LRU2_9ACTN|nr:MAG: Phosphate transport regulator (distant homolog of PhoU) [uncultured Nocardioidaceae bacterium]
MPLRFRPVDTTFYDLFAESAAHLVDGAALLAEILGTGNDRHAIAKRMRDAEHAADETTHAIVRRVNSTFVTPFDREDIYSLASSLDDVMDFMEEAVDLVLLYEIHELPGELATQVEVLQRAADLTSESMPRLQSMKNLEEYWIEINRLENTGDKSYRRILAKLFGGGYEALEVLKLKDVVDSLEAAIDAFEKVANIIEQIAVKES